MNTPIGYVEVNAGSLIWSCKEYQRRRFRHNLLEIRLHIKELMTRRKGWPWNRKNWTRQDAERYLRSSVSHYTCERIYYITLPGCDTSYACDSLLGVARNGNTHTVLVDVKLWDKILNSFKEIK